MLRERNFHSKLSLIDSRLPLGKVTMLPSSASPGFIYISILSTPQSILEIIVPGMPL
jgi:hypothetical protein